MYRRILAVGGAATLLVGLGACSAVPETPDGWRVAALEFDGALEGSPEAVTDVTYSMSIASDDTEGGFWTESAGSWLHVTADGDATRRYNTSDEFTAEHGAISVRGISASSPTMLVVSKTAGDDAFGPESGLFWYNTSDETWSRAHPDAITTGDVDVDADGRIVFVDFLGEFVPDTYNPEAVLATPQPYAIRAIDSDGVITTVQEPDPAVVVSASDAVDVDTDSAGTVYVSTETETYALDADGTRSVLSTYTQQTPRLAANAAGDILMPSADPVATEDANDRSVPAVDDYSVTDGSQEARDVLDAHRDCSTAEGSVPETPTPGSAPVSSLSLLRQGESPESATALPFSCGATPVALADHEFVLAIGDEAGTVLARVTPPKD